MSSCWCEHIFKEHTYEACAVRKSRWTAIVGDQLKTTFRTSAAATEQEIFSQFLRIMEDKRNEFNNWLLSKVGKQSCMISRAYGEKIIQYLRDKREKGQDDPDVKSKYEPNFRFTIKKRKFTLLNVVGLGDILCLPIKDKVGPD